MDRLEYKNYEEFAFDISETFDNIEDEFEDVSIIAKYDEAKEIIRELLCIGYDIANIEIELPELGGYDDEYILSVNFDGVWCERFKRDTSYFNDVSNVTYIMDNCSSAIIPYCKSENLYEVSVDDIDNSENDDEESEAEHTYTINGKTVDKETFDKYISKFAPDLVDENSKKNATTDSGYSVTVKVGLDTDEAENMIRDMRKNFQREFSDMFDMLYRPYLYEYRPHPIRLFW